MSPVTAVEISLWVSLGLFVLDAIVGFPATLLVYRIFAWCFIQLELGALKIVHAIVRPDFVLQGDCHRCGACCEHIVGDPPRFIKNSKLFSATSKKLFLPVA